MKEDWYRRYAGDVGHWWVLSADGTHRVTLCKAHWIGENYRHILLHCRGISRYCEQCSRKRREIPLPADQ